MATEMKIIRVTHQQCTVITVNCPFCRAPVDMELDRAGTTYRPMEESC